MNEHSDRFEDLITDLYYLRKGDGFTASRIYNASTLVRVLGGQQVFENLKSRFVSAIESLPEARSRQSLLVAYALDSDYVNTSSLKQRREKLGREVDRKYDTLTNRENAAISELAVRLLTASYSNAPLPANTPLPHGRYLLESLKVETLMVDRKFVRHTQHRRVVALAAGAQSFDYHVDDQTILVPLSNCTIDTESFSAGSIHKIIFPKPLKRGQSHEFAFIEKRKVEVGEYQVQAIDWAGQVFQTPTLSYAQRVKFEGEQPDTVWSYCQMTNIERPGKPTGSNRLVIDEQRIAGTEFKQLYGGFYSGVAWEW